MKENEYRTHNCNEISLDDVGKKVRIAGFVQTIRDLGGLVFLDIRDMYGITQVVTSAEAADVDFASHIPIESSVTVLGTVRKRDEETVNPKIKTGLVEIKIEEIKVLGKRTKDLPFEVNSNQDVIKNVAIVSKESVLKTLKDSQTETGHYTYQSVNIAKYKIDGENKLLYIAPREVTRKDRTYNSNCLLYTSPSPRD
mgnify:FL=1